MSKVMVLSSNHLISNIFLIFHRRLIRTLKADGASRSVQIRVTDYGALNE